MSHFDSYILTTKMPDCAASGHSGTRLEKLTMPTEVRYSVANSWQSFLPDKKKNGC
jgi:hypothetical protein